ncbi:hypothetical protein QCA50_002453 [Cerrena zonata]|uniref:Uncharacterized protein n=1 Tax=Cerrena zonata TaxID=2478898 RepID=A0AAW0GNU7_9APHY
MGYGTCLVPEGGLGKSNQGWSHPTPEYKCLCQASPPFQAFPFHSNPNDVTLSFSPPTPSVSPRQLLRSPWIRTATVAASPARCTPLSPSPPAAPESRISLQTHPRFSNNISVTATAQLHSIALSILSFPNLFLPPSSHLSHQTQAPISPKLNSFLNQHARTSNLSIELSASRFLPPAISISSLLSPTLFEYSAIHSQTRARMPGHAIPITSTSLASLLRYPNRPLISRLYQNLPRSSLLVLPSFPTPYTCLSLSLADNLILPAIAIPSHRSHPGISRTIST